MEMNIFLNIYSNTHGSVVLWEWSLIRKTNLAQQQVCVFEHIRSRWGLSKFTRKMKYLKQIVYVYHASGKAFQKKTITHWYDICSHRFVDRLVTTQTLSTMNIADISAKEALVTHIYSWRPQWKTSGTYRVQRRRNRGLCRYRKTYVGHIGATKEKERPT